MVYENDGKCGRRSEFRNMTTLELERLANVEGRLSVLQALIMVEVALTGSVLITVLMR